MRMHELLFKLSMIQQRCLLIDFFGDGSPYPTVDRAAASENENIDLNGF